MLDNLKKDSMMLMCVVAFSIVGQKSGMEKTTTAVNLSVSLAQKGTKTLLIDFNQACGPITGLGYSKESQGNLYEILHDTYDPGRNIKKTRFANLSLIPSDENL